MADDLERFEAALGAVAKITSDDVDMVGARCPKCDASDFVQVSDLFYEAAARLEEQPNAAKTVRVGNLTDAQIVAKFRPPRRGSAFVATTLTAIPLGVASYYIYRRFGGNIGQTAIVASIVGVVIVLLTSIRRLSDRYYRERKRWRSLYICRRCGQLVAA